MTTERQAERRGLALGRGMGAWAAAGAVLAVVLALLTLWVKQNPLPARDREFLDWVAGWDMPGLAGFFRWVDFLTASWPAVALGAALVVVLWLIGRTQDARAIAVVGAVIGVGALALELALGAVVARDRPVPAAVGYSFPSGHVLGSTVLLGFWGFVIARLGLRKRYEVPLLAALGVMVLAAGLARIYSRVHWPTDVAAGYILGVLWLMAVIILFRFLRRAVWPPRIATPPWLTETPGEGFQVVGSLASSVVLDPNRGTATKLYRPPPAVRVLYWVAFQAPFAYERSEAALETAAWRRKIAGLLTRYRFGEDLVAPVVRIGRAGSRLALVTEYVPGETPPDDAATRRFLARLTGLFEEAGLGSWQVNPHNPHAHTNLVRTPAGDLKIIDLESALITLFPATRQWGAAFRSGAYPVFDDVDFVRLKGYVRENAAALQERLGMRGLDELRQAIDRGEQAYLAWKSSEPRWWGRGLRLVFGHGTGGKAA